MRSSFTRVAVISCGEAPEGGFYSPTSGKWSGAAKGTLAGIDACAQGGELGFLLMPLGVLIGAVYGAIEAVPNAEVEASASSIDRALAETCLGVEIQNNVAEEAVNNTGYEVVLVDFDCPDVPDARPDYRVLSGTGVSTVIEVEVDDFGFEGREADIDPEIYLAMYATVRLIDTKDGSLLYERSFGYAGEKQTYSTWAHNNASKLQREIRHACKSIARDIVREVFIAGQKDT